MKINDPPPAFSWTRMNRDRRAPGVRHKISPAKYLQICEMYWTLHMGLQYMRWLSGLLPTSRQLMKLNHLQHSRHLTSTRVCDWCQVQSTFLYTFTLYKADARSFIHVRYELDIDVCGSGFRHDCTLLWLFWNLCPSDPLYVLMMYVLNDPGVPRNVNRIIVKYFVVISSFL